MEHLSDKTAFITGGASGIGLGIAKACARYGMKVVITDSRRDALDEAKTYFIKTGSPVHAIKLDVTNREAFAKAADETEKIFKKIHLLVNNAGVGSGGPVQDMTYDDWDFSMDINVGGVINGLVTILPRILKHGEGGHIVSTSSTGGIIAVGGCTIYCATKYAVTGIMECVATDLRDKGIGASVLIPGPTKTNLMQSTAANRAEYLKHHEMQPGTEAPLLKDGKSRRLPTALENLFMDSTETGERVIRGILRNDLFIITHPEFKDGIVARNQALLRAIPDQPPNIELHSILKRMGSLVYNPIYNSQTQVGKLDFSI